MGMNGDGGRYSSRYPLSKNIPINTLIPGHKPNKTPNKSQDIPQDVIRMYV